MKIKAPFNFVPISEAKVAGIDWWNQITQDIPFEDSESACLSIKITAASPMYIRNGTSSSEVKNETQSFLKYSSYNDKYFIPGSSIKGSIRNVFEIVTFSAMGNVDDHQYAYRDFSNSHNEYLTNFREHKQLCGWLTQDDQGNWEIENHGEPGRILLDEVDKCLGSNSKLSTYFGNRGRANYSDDSEKTAMRKYEKAGNPSFEQLNFQFEKDEVSKCYKEAFSDGRDGTIVLTGQPSPKKKKDFIIFDDILGVISVPKCLQSDFRFAYHEAEREKESIDWAHWRKLLDVGKRVPIFFRLKKNSKDIQDMGLTYMYKLPYERRTSDCIAYTHKADDSQDMTRGLFGHVDKNNALRGRVQFSHAFAVGQPKEMSLKKEILSGPKASFYPIYLEQKNKRKDDKVSKHTTYNNAQGVIRGWKRYPVHSGNSVITNQPQGSVSEKIFTKFKPLDTGTVFEGKIRFHNLRKCEIGALLSALTFHSTDDCFHSIGMCKPLGYGKIKLEILKMEGLNHSLEGYLKEFERFLGLSKNPIINWTEQSQITELFTMATEQKNSGSSDLSYMTLDEYTDVKKTDNMLYLKTYSELPGVLKNNPVPFISNSEMEVTRSNEMARKLQEKKAAVELEKTIAAEELRTQKVQRELESEEEKQKVEQNGIFDDTASSLNLALKQIKKYHEAIERSFNQDELAEVREKLICIANSNKRMRKKLIQQRKKSSFWQDLYPNILSVEFITDLQKDLS